MFTPEELEEKKKENRKIGKKGKHPKTVKVCQQCHFKSALKNVIKSVDVEVVELRGSWFDVLVDANVCTLVLIINIRFTSGQRFADN